MKRWMTQTVSLLLTLAMVCVLLPGRASAESKDMGEENVDLTGYGYDIIVDAIPHQMTEDLLNEYRAFGKTMGYLSRNGMIRYEPKEEEAYFTGERIDLDLDGFYDITISVANDGIYYYLVYKADPETRLSGDYPMRLNSEDRKYLDDDPNVSLYYSTINFKFSPYSEYDLGTEHMDLSVGSHRVIVDGPPHQMDEDTLKEFHAQSKTFGWLINSNRIIKTHIPGDGNTFGKLRYDLDCDGHFDIYSVVPTSRMFSTMDYYADPETNLYGSYTLNLTKAEQAELINADPDYYYSGLRFEFPMFSDTKLGKYYTMPVRWAYCHDPRITAGSSEGLFNPNQTCTREQIVTFLWKAAGAPEPDSPEDLFTDVKPGKYYTKAVQWAVQTGITTGVGDGKFGVGKPCTREQVVTFLWKAWGSRPPKYAENPFSDVEKGKYYYYAVLWANMNDITSGTSASVFGVGKPCTRGQIVTFLYKAAQLD